MVGIVSFLSGIWVWLIIAFAVVNVFAWIFLVSSARRSSREMGTWLRNLVAPLARRRDIEPDAHQLDSIDAFLADVRDVVEHPRDEQEINDLQQRMLIKSETRPHGVAHKFERIYGLCRASIEAFPLLGILGTVLAIAAGMQASSDGESASKVSQVVTNFGESVYCTGAGIFFAIAFTLVNGWFEPDFSRVITQGHSLEELILAVKKKVGFAPK